MRIYKTKAIVLDNVSNGFNRNKVVLFTENFGKIILKLTGYGRSPNHWAGVFDAANILGISFTKRGNFYVVTGWELVHFSPDRSIGDFAVKELILEVANEIIPLSDPDSNLFRWLSWSIKNISVSTACVFLARIIYQGGFMDFADSDLRKLLSANFAAFIKEKLPEEVDGIMKKEVSFIEGFTGKDIKSYSLYQETCKKFPIV